MSKNKDHIEAGRSILVHAQQIIVDSVTFARPMSDSISSLFYELVTLWTFLRSKVLVQNQSSESFRHVVRQGLALLPVAENEKGWVEESVGLFL